MHAKDTRAAEGIEKKREGEKGKWKKSCSLSSARSKQLQGKIYNEGPPDLTSISDERRMQSFWHVTEGERDGKQNKEASQKFEIFRPYECIHGTLYMHYKCQINARLSRNDIPSIWNDPQRDEKHPKWEVNALDSVHFSPNKDIASRPDNTNEFRSHSETHFWNVTPGYLRSSAFFIRRRSELSFSHCGKNRSLFHTSLAIAEINTGAGKRNINRGWCRSICRNGTGENKTKKRRSGAALEGDTDGQEPLWWRLLLAWCHQPQTPFVCQATKLIEIKAGSRWPGIIKSLTNTNKAEKEGARRGGFLWPAESERRDAVWANLSEVGRLWVCKQPWFPLLLFACL